jgi:phosphopentomutase
MVNRVIILVFDSLGVGALPDAADYGDTGANTLGNIARQAGGLSLPEFERLGLGNIIPIDGVLPADKPAAAFGKLTEVSHGKDTTVGLWEMMGIQTKYAFPVFPKGFPPAVVEKFTGQIGCGILGNKAASGTDIIEELGEEHLRTGMPIVYTSADSVFQIAAHEDVVPIDKLYEYCLAARNILTGELGVDRVIARPFKGAPGNFERTERRKDFGLPPQGKMVLDFAAEAGLPVIGIGKVRDVFSGRGISGSVKTKDNADGFRETENHVKEGGRGIIFTILGDFDTLWGHRNDTKGYAKGLVEADRLLGKVVSAMQPDDVLFIVADHGCDPTMPGTDHSREYVPALIVGSQVNPIAIGVRSSMSDIGKTVADMLRINAEVPGISFAKDILIKE